MIDNIEAKSIPRGAASRSLNWLTKGDKIELRRGYAVLGTEQTGAGRVSGLHVTKKASGTSILVAKRGRKLVYYDTVTEDFIEVGTDLFPAAASSDDVLFSDYYSLAGAQMWFGSPNSSLYKIMTANPGSYSDQYDNSKNFIGWIKIKQNRMFLWGRTADKTGVYGSYIDAASYTTVTSEVIGSGDALTRTFTGTLAFKGGGAKRTCFAVTFTDGTETFSDDYNGVLTGSAGGTGTINYMTGAYSITFAVAPSVGVNNVTSTYQWENATNTGIADFSKSAPRTAGQGFVFRQDDGGADTLNVMSYGDTEYCLHIYKTWALTLTATDTNATNLIFRDKVGIPFIRASVATGDGVYYIDDSEKDEPKFRLLTLSKSSTEVIPTIVTLNVDFSDYRFDKAVMYEWGDYVIIACRHKDSTVNNRTFFWNKEWKAMDPTDYFVSSLVDYNGTLVAGESSTDNICTLLSGFDDQDALIDNYWEGNLDNLGIENLKKTKRLRLEGDIQPNQSYTVYLALDNSAYVQVGTISGNGSYVDRGQSVNVGATTIGSKEVGGGSSSVSAYHYKYELPLAIDKFEEAKVKFVATEIGYVSISLYGFMDIRQKYGRIASKYR